ncbi:hypothetical protein [Geodermatophilus sp. SYSU D01119]
MLPLTPVPPQTAGERALFAELARWDRGGAVRGAVVASLPVVDGPMERRISDAVLFVPEGVAVVRVAEVRQSGVVTATPEGSWTIGPGAGPGEVLQIAGGGSTPLDGLMRAGMDAAVRLRRAGLEPGRIARLTVLVGDLTGLVPADGDLGDGDQVALSESRSLLLGISRAARYAGVDNPRLWTTADVRAALSALGYEGRGPTVEELNGEGFPYSPYVLRRRELLAPAAMAASAAGAAPAAAPAPYTPAPPASVPAPAPGRVPGGPLVDPVAAAAVAAAAIRADEEAAARAAAAGLAPAHAAPVPPPAAPPAGPPAVPVPPPAAPATARFDAPAVQSGAAVPAPVPAPAPAPEPPADETGGLGGLFGNDPTGPPGAGWPHAVPAPAAPAPAPAPVPLVGPRRRPSADRRRLLLLAVAGLAVVALLVGLVVGLAGGGDDDAAAQEPPAPTTAPATPTAAGPTPGTTSVQDGRTYVLQQVQTADTCLGNAYGDVASFFESTDCAGLARALWSTDVEGRDVVVSVSRVDMGDAAAARELRALADTNGSGNVSDLLREGVRYAGGPDGLSGAEYASSVAGTVVTIVESSWVDGGDGDTADLDVVAGTGLALPMPEPSAD